MRIYVVEHVEHIYIDVFPKNVYDVINVVSFPQHNSVTTTFSPPCQETGFLQSSPFCSSMYPNLSVSLRFSYFSPCLCVCVCLSHTHTRLHSSTRRLQYPIFLNNLHLSVACFCLTWQRFISQRIIHGWPWIRDVPGFPLIPPPHRTACNIWTEEDWVISVCWLVVGQHVPVRQVSGRSPRGGGGGGGQESRGARHAKRATGTGNKGEEGVKKQRGREGRRWGNKRKDRTDKAKKVWGNDYSRDEG